MCSTSKLSPAVGGRPCRHRSIDVVTPDELARTYAAAWLEEDSAKRLGLLHSCCEDDVRFVQEGLDEISGVRPLSDAIGEFIAAWPEGGGVTVEITSDIQEHHGFGRGSFVWKYPGQEDFTGTDFVELGPNGKMKTIVVFGDPPS